MFCVCVLMLWEPRTIIELESIKQNEICKYSINLVHLAISGRIRWIDGGFNFHSSHWRDGISDDANRYRKKMEIMTFGWAVEIKHIYLHELSSFFTLHPPSPSLSLSRITDSRQIRYYAESGRVFRARPIPEKSDTRSSFVFVLLVFLARLWIWLQSISILSQIFRPNRVVCTRRLRHITRLFDVVYVKYVYMLLICVVDPNQFSMFTDLITNITLPLTMSHQIISHFMWRNKKRPSS